MRKKQIIMSTAVLLVFCCSCLFGGIFDNADKDSSDEMLNVGSEEIKIESAAVESTAIPVITPKPTATKVPVRKNKIKTKTAVKKEVKTVQKKEVKKLSKEEKKINKILDGLKEKHKDRIAMKTKIVIKTTHSEGSQAQEIKGNVIIKKKDKFKVHYTEPAEQFLISDGKTLWVYTPSIEQVITQSADSVSLNTTFYIEIEKSIEFFVNNSKTTLAEEGEDYVFQMIPQNKKKLDFDEIMVKIKKEVLIPKYISMKFEGVLIEVFFYDIENFIQKEVDEREELQDSNFAFKAPEGVDVIEAQELFGNTGK